MTNGHVKSTGPADKVVTMPRSRQRSGGGAGGDTQPNAISLTPGEQPRILDAIGQRLAAAELDLYVRGGQVVRLVHARTPVLIEGIERPSDRYIIHPVTDAHLAELAERAVRFQRFDARRGALVPSDLPRRYGRSFLDRGEFPFPILRSVIEHPTLRPDGSILLASGYDPASGLYLIGDVPEDFRIPNAPTFDDARAAADVLMDWLGEFAHAEACDEIAAIAAVIGALVRPTLPAAPLICITAPTPGTGKSLLSDCICLVTSGRQASVIAYGRDPAEFEKRLAGAYLAGQGYIAVDNVEAPLLSDLLCQVATQHEIRIRPLGGSSLVTVPTSVTLAITGNNLDIRGDLRRRVLLVRLDAGVERPEERRYRRDIISYTREHRWDLIRAALTIPTAYLAAGATDIDTVPYGGFGAWDRLVRRPLLWLGYPDPLGGAYGLRDYDPDYEATRSLLVLWREQFGEQAVTAAEVVAAAGGGIGTGNTPLWDALQIICSEKVHARRLGYWLRRHAGRVVDGMHLQRAGQDGHAKVTTWRVCG